MSGPESTYWSDHVRPALVGWDPVRVENLLGLGTPDVNYNQGWIELKVLKEWPKRETTLVRVKHFTKEQRLWLRMRIIAGGRAHVLIKIGRDSLLMWGDEAAMYLGMTRRIELLDHATLIPSLTKGLKYELSKPHPSRRIVSIPSPSSLDAGGNGVRISY